MTPEVFTLSPGERHSALWVRLRAEMERRIAEKRAKNDAELDEIKTAHLRGQIACLKALIDLGNTPPQDG